MADTRRRKPAVDMTSHPLAGPVQVALDRPFGHAQVLGNLDNRPILLVEEKNDLALLLI